ncbi:MAG: hypothetical protein ACREHE_16770 [Rhizomicrobium sp.]
MRAKLVLVVPFLLMGTAPVWAQATCGTVPFAPAMPSQADMKSKPVADAETALHDAFTDIKNWQSDLKTYRACLDGQRASDKSQLAGLDKTKDADTIKTLTDQIKTSDVLYDKSVDQEESVVNEFHAAQNSYCQRSDANKSKCPK